MIQDLQKEYIDMLTKILFTPIRLIIVMAIILSFIVRAVIGKITDYLAHEPA